MMRHVVLLCALLVVPVPVMAQSGGWEFEVHGGGLLMANASGGSGSLPDLGSSFTTVTSRSSRHVASWFFGDGAELFNGTAAGLGIPERITSLDPVLNNPLAERQDGGSFGFRVSREVTPRVAAEFNFDFTSTPLEMPAASVAGIQASSTSFVPAWNALLDTGPFVGVRVGSTDTIQDSEGTQMVGTGALNINLTTQGRFIPYVTVGAGVISNTGDTPTANLEGSYTFDIFDAFPTNETDKVSLHHAIDDNVFVGVFGGGVKVFLTPRSGIRVDVRVHLGATTGQTLLDAKPDVATSSPAFALASRTDPSIQFSNDPSIGEESTLTGPDIDGFQSFSVGGVQSQILVTGGYFWKR